MYHKLLIIAFKNQTSFYKTLKPLNFLYLLIIYIFISWNGIQFLLNPKHVVLISNLQNFNRNIQIMLSSQTNVIPFVIFIILTFAIIIYLLKLYFEIGLNNLMKTEKIGIKQKINILIDFVVPNLYYMFGVIFIQTTIYLALIIIYLLLLTFGLFIVLDIYEIIVFTAIYYLIGFCVFNACMIDFVLPEMMSKKTFSEQFKLMLSYFSNNILNIVAFYLFKLILVLTSLILFVYFLMYAIPNLTSIINMPLIEDLSDITNATTTLILSAITSMVLFSFFINFFSIYCRFLKIELFADYFEKSIYINTD